MTGKLRIGVIFGGRSGEHEISLVSSRHILDVLDPKKYQVIQIGITKKGNWIVGDGVWDALSEDKVQEMQTAAMLPIPDRTDIYTIDVLDDKEVLNVFAEVDVIFPVLHGTFGEDGTLQGLLDLADIAYVGAGVLGSAVGMDKALFKDVMIAHQIPVVPALLVRRFELEDMGKVLDRVEEFSRYPVFVKPANMGSSVGVHKCRDVEEAALGLEDAARYDRRILIEKGINAREIELSVLGNDQPRVSVPGEIRPQAEFYSYQAKYHDEGSELIIPAPLSEEKTALFQKFALKAYRAVDCAGMARVDFLLDKDTNQIYINELNTIPGFTPISMYPKLWEASGLSYEDLIDELIQLALERKRDRDRTIWTYSG